MCTLHLKEQFPVLFNIAKHHDATISEYWSEHSWNFTFRRNTNDWEFDSVSSVMLRLHSQTLIQPKADTLIWRDAKGKFKVRSYYQILRNSSSSFSKWPWRIIWRNKTPLKVDCFLWLVDHGVCLTQDNLQKRRITICSRYP